MKLISPRSYGRIPSIALGYRLTDLSVPEVPDAGEDHRHARPVRGFDDLIVADRATRLGY